MPVTRRSAPPVSSVPASSVVSQINNYKSPFATVVEASAYLKESTRTIRELVHRGIFKLVPNSPHLNRKTKTLVVTEKPWRLLWSEIEQYAAEQTRKAA